MMRTFLMSLAVIAGLGANAQTGSLVADDGMVLYELDSSGSVSEDGVGDALFFEADYILDANHDTLAHIEGDTLLDANNDLLGYLSSNIFYDANHAAMAVFNGSNIEDVDGLLIASYTGNLPKDWMAYLLFFYTPF